MSGQMDYRARLTEAIDGFLERTPSSIAHAHDIVRSCSESLASFSIKSLIWNSVIAPLTDSIWYENKANLLALKQRIRGDVHHIGRAFVRYNFFDVFTLTERDWLTKLSEMLAFLLPFPEGNVVEAISVYERLCAELQEVCGQVAPVDDLGDMTTYRLVLHEVTAIVTTIAMKVSIIRYHYPIPRAPVTIQDGGWWLSE